MASTRPCWSTPVTQRPNTPAPQPDSALAFGVIAATAGDDPLMRADGVASIGVGLFGVLITLIPYRRRERWAWFALWFYPVFWVVHLVGRLPPSKDHVHQMVFIVLSLAGLLLPVR